VCLHVVKKKLNPFNKVQNPMSTDQINAVIQSLQPIFCDVFDDDDLVLEATTMAQDVDGWDSLAHIRLVVSIEKAFGLRFSASEISDLENVGEMAALVLRKQASV
jgi:acyl carrier protein